MTNIAERFSAREREGSHPNQRPRDASTLILIDRSGRSGDGPKVLLGRRHQGHAFMPGKFVFPGGRLEPADKLMPAATPLKPQVEAQLLRAVRKPSPGRARAYALAAIRETFEETGLLLGVRRADAPAIASPHWEAFAAARVHPDLGAMHFIARAITPPRRARRFDTRFFAAEIDAVAHRVDGVVGPDAELVELVWMPLAQARELDLAAITRVVLEDLERRIGEGLGHDLPVPFYRLLNRRFVRELL
jgi:8-oxo-dGTP pyrophosphatase MutT (NUDIX family)